MSPLEKLALMTFGLLTLLKAVAWGMDATEKRSRGRLLYWLWPGMRPESFAARSDFPSQRLARAFFQGVAFFAIGLTLQAALAFWGELLPRAIFLYAGLLSFLLLIHLGLSEFLYVGLNLIGFRVERLFVEPYKSKSLKEFWSHRWNIAFVDMNRRLFVPILGRGVLGLLGVFLISGLLHEGAISFPVGAGYGGPSLYFLIQGLLFCIESRLAVLRKPIIGRLWTALALLAPLPLLFHEPFLQVFIQPYFEWLGEHLRYWSLADVLSGSVYLAGLGHLLVLVASAQVPSKLKWREEFVRLSPFNQKIFWTYGAFIVAWIVSFAAIDLAAHDTLLEAHSSSVILSLLIAGFWTLRLLVDAFYFSHQDWPEGEVFVIGHFCLSTLFVFLALTHWALVIHHVFA